MEEKEVLTPEAKAVQDKVVAPEAKPDIGKTFEDIQPSILEKLYELDRKEFRKDIKKYNDITQEKIKKERSTYQKKKAEYYKVINRTLTGQDLQYILTQMKGVLRAGELVNNHIDNLESTLIRKGILTQKDIDETDGILKKEAKEKEAKEKVEMKKVIDKKE